MKILLVAYPLAPVCPGAVGGAEQIVSVLDRGLVRAGHESVVVACEGSEVEGALVSTPFPQGELDSDAIQRAHSATLEAVQCAIAEHSPDLIHFHGLDFSNYLPGTGIPMLATLHLAPELYPDAIWNAGVFLHCVSESQERACPHSSCLLPPIPNGVAIPKDVPAVKEDYVLAMGRICPEKGFHLAIDAARAAGLPIVVAGGLFSYATHKEYFEQEIKPRLKAPDVRFAGAVSGERKQELLAGARCVVIPSLVAETSSLVAMEAAAAGTPVVAFSNGALPEVVANGNTGLLVENAAALPDALHRASEELSPAACRTWAQEHFSESRMTSRYLGTYAYLQRRSEYEVEAVSECADWERLFESSRSATPFQHPVWLRAFSREDRLLLQISHRGTVVGLAPLRLWEGKVRFLGEGISDYLDILAEPEHEGHTARATLEWLRRHQFGTELTDLPPDSALRYAAPDHRRSVCPVLDLEAETVPAKLLKSLRTASRTSVLEAHTARLHEVPDYLDALFRLHQHRWEERGEPGVLVDPWVREFHRRVAPEFAKYGLLRFHGLKHKGELVAVLYCFAAKGRTYYYLGGFDSQYSRSSPGAQLVHYAIESARAEGCREFDFLRGAEPYKYRWGAKDRWNYTVRLQALT